MKKTVLVGSRELSYELTRKNVKNINIRVRTDLTVAVSAGKNVPESVIRDFVISKSRFIFDALDRFRCKQKKETDHDSLSVLGASRKIKITEGEKNVSLSENDIVISVPNTSDRNSISLLFENWKKMFFLSVCDEICRGLFPYFVSRGIQYPKIRVRMMKSRWGSCVRDEKTRSGSITINLMLLSAPIECIELVVAHELSHLICRGHSDDFYSVLSDVLPDHAERKKILNKIIIE